MYVCMPSQVLLLECDWQTRLSPKGRVYIPSSCVCVGGASNYFKQTMEEVIHTWLLRLGCKTDTASTWLSLSLGMLALGQTSHHAMKHTRPREETTWSDSGGQERKLSAKSQYQQPDTWVKEPADDSFPLPVNLSAKASDNTDQTDKHSMVCPIWFPNSQNPCS